MPKKLFVLLGDVKSSREIKNRKLFQEKLIKVCNELNQEYQQNLYADFKILKGLDEIGGVLTETSSIYKIISKITNQIYPNTIRFILVRDYIDTALNSKDVTRMDGPAFHKASERMKLLKKSKTFFDMVTYNETIDSSLIIMINLMLLYKERWTKKQRQIIEEYEKTLNQKKVAFKYNITQQAVSKVINNTKWKNIKDLENQLNQIIGKLGVQLK
ncbi:MAG: SatD family protein [Methanobacterium sp.]|jgi:predicted DNA-binding protein YlxM (UPF0122 family)